MLGTIFIATSCSTSSLVFCIFSVCTVPLSPWWHSFLCQWVLWSSVGRPPGCSCGKHSWFLCKSSHTLEANHDPGRGAGVCVWVLGHSSSYVCMCCGGRGRGVKWCIAAQWSTQDAWHCEIVSWTSESLTGKIINLSHPANSFVPIWGFHDLVSRA